jgi:glycerol-3-phosphate dehydrogenase
MVLKMVKEAGGNILFHTYFSDTIMKDNQVTGIICEAKSSRQAIYGKIVIDASGDGGRGLPCGCALLADQGR